MTLLAGFRPASGAVAALFGREELFTLNSTDISTLKNSGFTTIILFVVDVESNGDLNYNGDHLIVQNGTWVGDTGWAGRLAQLKQAPTTIYRLEVCTGGSGAPSWTNIKNLIASQGTGSTSILYKNFQCLKNTLGVDAICNDDEVQFDATSAAQFGNMIAGLGMKATLCPYNNQSYWQSVKSQLGSNCDAVYLQCYDGGAGNDPGSWNSLFGGFRVIPGDWNSDSASTVQSKMNSWQNATGAPGGFMWQYELIGNTNLASYAAAVYNGIGLHSGTYRMGNLKSGLVLDANGGGTGNGTTLIQWGYSGSTNMQWTMNFIGSQAKIIGVNSGRAVTVTGNSMSDNAPLELLDYSGATDQLVTFNTNPNGYYTPIFVSSGKAMTVAGASTSAGAAVIQYTYNGGSNAQWQFRAP